jgi:hypothetical protein
MRLRRVGLGFTCKSTRYGYEGNYTIHLRGPGQRGELLEQVGANIVGLVVGQEYCWWTLLSIPYEPILFRNRGLQLEGRC